MRMYLLATQSLTTGQWPLSEAQTRLSQTTRDSWTNQWALLFAEATLSG